MAESSCERCVTGQPKGRVRDREKEIGFRTGTPDDILMYPSPVSIWSAFPFLILLASIAIVPLVSKSWWEKFYPAVSIGLGVFTICFYTLFLGIPGPVIDSGYEYVSFMALVGSLFVIAGGIHIKLRGRSRPLTNVIFLAVGAVVANILGTTGASMIMIRPYIRVNHYRIKPYHVIFFIFIVSNIGGALTPVGDPPLFVGYLKGIPFFWPIANLWYIWLFAVAAILAVYYMIDRRDFARLPVGQQHLAEEMSEHGEIVGLHNILFLVVVLAAVFVTNPPFLREGLMILAATGSYLTTPRDIHKKNDFDFLPIKEVAILFFGIFATMVPALDWIRQNSAAFGFRLPAQFYWSSGALSSVLDNTPTYLNFLSAALGVFVSNGVVGQIHNLVLLHGAGLPVAASSFSPDIRSTIGTLMTYHPALVASRSVSPEQIATMYLLSNRAVIVQAISIGAVFFGAMTYIGNGPNFMVKSIAEQTGVRCPSFITYIIRYTLPVLLPLFLIIWFVFFYK